MSLRDDRSVTSFLVKRLMWNKLCYLALGMMLCLPLGQVDPTVLVGRMLISLSRSQRPLASVHTEAGLLLHVFKGRVWFNTVFGWECCM